MGLADYFHSVATGPKRRREFLTPLGFLIFGSTLAVVIVVGLYTDRWLGLPTLMPGIVGAVVGVLFLTTVDPGRLQSPLEGVDCDMIAAIADAVVEFLACVWDLAVCGSKYDPRHWGCPVPAGNYSTERRW